MLKPRYPLLIIAALCAVLTSCARPTDSYTDTAGNPGYFSDYRGRWILINYWATWCKPCIEEIPQLNAFARAWPEDVIVFSVNYDGKQGQQLIEQSEKLGIEFPTLTADPAATLGFKRPDVLPTTVIFDRAGHLYKTLSGPQTQQTLTHMLSLQ